ncbi:MAG: leucine-rich repeat domain-containing protein [Oscillospiraceae bacterium]|nr:leucine-rich repeat domain-containing protein [Oscillospiraceae bacterium]
MGAFIEDNILKRYTEEDGVTEAVIPEGVTAIRRSAFDGCGKLTDVKIPDTVTSIGDDAFRWCKSLTSAVIPDSVTELGMLAFQDCGKLASVTIGSGIREIGYAVFRGCYSLKTFTVAGVTITKPGEANSEQIGDICNMILKKDYAVQMSHPVKHAVLAQLFLADYDEENLFPYIKKNFTKFCTFLIGSGNVAAVAKTIENGKLFSKRNIDKFIELAINGGQHEIYVLLLNCKNEMTGMTDPTAKLKL